MEDLIITDNAVIKPKVFCHFRKCNDRGYSK